MALLLFTEDWEHVLLCGVTGRVHSRSLATVAAGNVFKLVVA
jgi:hypothetical protein